MQETKSNSLEGLPLELLRIISNKYLSNDQKAQSSLVSTSTHFRDKLQADRVNYKKLQEAIKGFNYSEIYNILTKDPQFIFRAGEPYGESYMDLISLALDSIECKSPREENRVEQKKIASVLRILISTIMEKLNDRERAELLLVLVCSDYIVDLNKRIIVSRTMQQLFHPGLVSCLLEKISFEYSLNPIVFPADTYANNSLLQFIFFGKYYNGSFKIALIDYITKDSGSNIPDKDKEKIVAQLNEGVGDAYKLEKDYRIRPREKAVDFDSMLTILLKCREELQKQEQLRYKPLPHDTPLFRTSTGMGLGFSYNVPEAIRATRSTRATRATRSTRATRRRAEEIPLYRFTSTRTAERFAARALADVSDPDSSSIKPR